MQSTSMHAPKHSQPSLLASDRVMHPDGPTHPCLPLSADVESAAVGKLAAHYPDGAHSDVRPELTLRVIPAAHSLGADE